MAGYAAHAAVVVRRRRAGLPGSERQREEACSGDGERDRRSSAPLGAPHRELNHVLLTFFDCGPTPVAGGRLTAFGEASGHQARRQRTHSSLSLDKRLRLREARLNRRSVPGWGGGRPQRRQTSKRLLQHRQITTRLSIVRIERQSASELALRLFVLPQLSQNDAELLSLIHI